MSGKTKQRLVRPVERQPMRDWLLDKLNGKEIPGLEWVQKDQKVFRIKWCHGSRHGWSLKDSVLFEKWAQHSGRHHDGDPKRWKANFRCALNSLKDVEEVKGMSVSKGQNAFRVYRMLDTRKKSDKPRAARRRKSEPVTQRVPPKHQCAPRDTDASLSLPVGEMSDCNRTVMLEDDMKTESESEGYQTDVQEDPSMDWSQDDRITLPSAFAKTEIKSEETDLPSKINIPNFDKIIPGFYKVDSDRKPSKHLFEFGKNHLLPRHSSGFKVEQLKQQTPLTPTLQPFNLSIRKNFQSQSTTARSSTSYSTHPGPNATFTLPTGLSSQQTISTSFLSQVSDKGVTKISESTRTSGNRDNFSCLSFPETPDGSEASSDSNSNSGEFIELTIYEEEVTDTPVTLPDDCLVLTNLSSCMPVMSQHTIGKEQYGPGQVFTSANSYTYNPLTPP